MAATQIQTRQIANNAITTAKINALAVTTAKINTKAVGFDKLLLSTDFTGTINQSGLEAFGPTSQEIRVKPGPGITVDANGVSANGLLTASDARDSLSITYNGVNNSNLAIEVDGFPQWTSDAIIDTIGMRIWYNTTDDSYKGTLANLTKLRFGGTISVASSSSSAIANTVTETNFSNAGATIQAGDSAQEQVYRISAWGTYSTTGTPTIQFRIKGGSANLAQGGNLTCVTAASGRVWHVDGVVVVRSVGGSGVLESRITSGVDNAVVNQRQGSQTLNNNNALSLSLSAAWSAASASNTITCTGWVVELVG